MIRTNFHTHTVYCDGRDTPEQMVRAALEKGFAALGFSGHSYLEIDRDYSMDDEAQRRYFDEVHALKEKYKGQIQIFCGLEQDCYSAPAKLPYDYLIGSVHHVKKGEDYPMTDGSLEQERHVLDTWYDGDFDAFAGDYFEVVGRVLDMTNADIVGHIDLILKNCEKTGYRPTANFLDCAYGAVQKLLPYGKPFEMNTGAMARGHRTTPYPHPDILRMIYEGGGRIMLHSDCHDAAKLDCGLELCASMARDVGFREHVIFTDHGFETVEW